MKYQGFPGLLFSESLAWSCFRFVSDERKEMSGRVNGKWTWEDAQSDPRYGRNPQNPAPLRHRKKEGEIETEAMANWKNVDVCSIFSRRKQIPKNLWILRQTGTFVLQSMIIAQLTHSPLYIYGPDCYIIVTKWSFGDGVTQSEVEISVLHLFPERLFNSNCVKLSCQNFMNFSQHLKIWSRVSGHKRQSIRRKINLA